MCGWCGRHRASSANMPVTWNVLRPWWVPGTKSCTTLSVNSRLLSVGTGGCGHALTLTFTTHLHPWNSAPQCKVVVPRAAHFSSWPLQCSSPTWNKFALHPSAGFRSPLLSLWLMLSHHSESAVCGSLGYLPVPQVWVTLTPSVPASADSLLSQPVVCHHSIPKAWPSIDCAHEPSADE